jgi:hypothetical protein
MAFGRVRPNRGVLGFSEGFAVTRRAAITELGDCYSISRRSIA